ncbi:hypothetical protein [Pseudoxanthomonas mexicana]|uniref:hypothetical protein n=1 Tax=Pseudoxanthomonas mexicana TaxID=128785 RepID=UPI0024E1BCBB|nr:hypothetical protein [Pseudoxanthomonas mexicana]
MSITAFTLSMALWSIKVDPDKRDIMLSAERCPTVIERWLPNGQSLRIQAEEVRESNSLHQETKNMEALGAEYSALMLRKSYEKNGSLVQMDFYGDLFYRGCTPAGLGSRKDVAVAYYEAAAIRHYAPAQWKFGRMLFEGDGIPQDTERGASWLSLAALEGSDEASMYLASKGMPVPQPLPKTTFQAMHEHAERAWDDRNRRYWSGILQDSTDLLISAAAIYVHTQSQASANSANRSTRTTPTKPITPSVQPTYKKQNTSAYTQVRMLTKPTYCYAYDAGSFDSGSTLYLRLSVFCH